MCVSCLHYTVFIDKGLTQHLYFSSVVITDRYFFYLYCCGCQENLQVTYNVNNNYLGTSLMLNLMELMVSIVC